eukprot:10203268-Lingulodinium_polyedra.AAC.1
MTEQGRAIVADRPPIRADVRQAQLAAMVPATGRAGEARHLARSVFAPPLARRAFPHFAVPRRI